MRTALTTLSTAALLALATSAASAAVTYIGDAIIPGNGTDLSGLPATILEDGVSRQNELSGFGSGLAYAGGNTFYALADRGPNKVAYTGGAAVDNTTSWDNRYQQFQINVTPNGTMTNGVYSSYTVNATNSATTLLSNSQGVQYIGLSTAFSTNPNIENHRLDPEGIRVAPDGTTWISDEYGPYILHFNQQGQEIGSLPLPAGFQIANPGPTATYEAANNTTGRTTNRGAEGLAISPDGKTLVVMMQSSLTQDGGLNGTNDRVLVYDLTNPSAAPRQYLYQLDSKATPISELLAVNNHQFLVDERDGNGGASGIKKLYSIDISQPTAPTDLTSTAYAGTTATNGLPTTGTPAGVTPLTKTLFADIGQLLNNASPSPFSNVDGTNGLPDKIEGYAWGPDLPDGRHLLLATNDNDFAQPGTVPGYANYIFAFAVDSSDVPNFQQEAFTAVPEPASLGLITLGSLFLIRRKFRQI
ncbi:MAG TPA: esterase-like activity of phytase family protein [Phycisphaerae bacterium]|nr:esterase-like activity of phytase family protein [Phycisphaerae bacterium]